MREKLYSLHYILKGLQTLSHAAYEPPPPTDYVLIDYNDAATFDANAGYVSSGDADEGRPRRAVERSVAARVFKTRGLGA